MAAERQATWIGRLKNALYSKMGYLLWINRLYLLLRGLPTAIHLFPVLNMKKFLLKIIIFVSILLVLSFARPLYLLDKDRYKHTVAGIEVYEAIHKSKQKNKSSAKILLGDSVADQMFDHKTYNDHIYSLACPQAIGMAGYFILLNNYLNAGNHVDTVYLLFTPSFSFDDCIIGFGNNYNQKYTYQYFLKPFYIDEYFPLFTETLIKQIHKIPYYSFTRCPHILTSNWAPNFVSKDEIDYTFLSPISVEYLVKIKELSIKHGFKVIAMAPPTKLSSRRSIENINKNEIVINNLDSVFKNYFENIIYLDDSNFSDGIHLKNPQKYTEYYKNNFMK